jgi:hypothetical protein
MAGRFADPLLKARKTISTKQPSVFKLHISFELYKHNGKYYFFN